MLIIRRQGSCLRLLSVALAFNFLAVACGEKQSDAGVQEDAAPTSKGETFFVTDGDVKVSVDDATATLVMIRGTIPAMTIVSSPASIKKLGQSYSTNLFFSSDFELQPGTYPVAFSYRKKTNTFGGSYVQRGAMFSHDTQGTVEVLEVGDKVKLRFSFTAYETSGGEGERRKVTIKGQAVTDMVDIF